jgi:DNA-binding MarR family transcriptional regulator
MNTKEIRAFRDRARRFRRALGGHLEGSCCGLDVTLAQCDVILEIGGAHATSVELARLLHLDTSTLSRTVDALVEGGLIVRAPDPSDRRYNNLALTEKGRTRYDELNVMGDENARRLLARMDPEKLTLAIEGFCLMADAIERDCCPQEGGR